MAHEMLTELAPKPLPLDAPTLDGGLAPLEIGLLPEGISAADLEGYAPTPDEIRTAVRNGVLLANALLSRD
jgi:hypothetical protein